MELPTKVTLQQALHATDVKETELHCPQDIIRFYTDGSKREMNEPGTVTGSGVCRQVPGQPIATDSSLGKMPVARVSGNLKMVQETFCLNARMQI